MREFRRAFKMLQNGSTFQQVCESPPEVPTFYQPQGYNPNSGRGRYSRGRGRRGGSSSRRVAPKDPPPASSTGPVVSATIYPSYSSGSSTSYIVQPLTITSTTTPQSGGGDDSKGWGQQHKEVDFYSQGS
jgi:hypothetical protein